MKAKTISLILLLILSIFQCGCDASNQDKPISKSGFYLDTVCTITIYDKNANRDILDKCFDLCKRYENMLSRTIESSDISKINENPTHLTEVNPDTAYLIKETIRYSEMSDGRYDATILPLALLWNIDEQSSSADPVIPSDEEISQALSKVNYKNIQVNDDKVSLTTDGCSLDLGSIAKGFIADKIKELLIKEGVKSAIIDLGGNILLVGGKPDDKDGETDFTIGIQKPFGTDGEYILKAKLKDKSIVTSGIYQRYFEKDGKIYHHILDTKTGYPADNDIYSVTIISDSSTKADALSTMVFLMGVDDGLSFVNKLEDTEAVIITSDNEIKCTLGLKLSDGRLIVK